jgi:hypothetical protein
MIDVAVESVHSGSGGSTGSLGGVLVWTVGDVAGNGGEEEGQSSISQHLLPEWGE